VYYELYIDVLFLENLVMDYLLLQLLRWMLCRSTTRLRLFFAAVFGSGSVCALCISSIFWTVPGRLIATWGISLFMVKIGFNIRNCRQLFLTSGLMYVLGFLLGGILEWMWGLLPGTFQRMMIWVLPAYLVLKGALRILMSGKRKKAVLCQVCIAYKGMIRRTTGLLDTGNSLYDPYYHKPVSIVERKILEPQILEDPLVLQIPYHSIGNTEGMMPALFVDYLSIRTEDQTYVIERPILGVTEESLSGDGSYNLILNPNLVDR